jgi:hypothetical protein
MLKRLFPVLSDLDHLTTIAKTIFYRVKDDDQNVKDLAVAAIEDLLFTPPKSSMSSKQNGSSPSFYETCSQVLMSVASDAQRLPPVEDTLKIIAAKRSDNVKASNEFNSMLSDLAAELVTMLTEDADMEAQVRRAFRHAISPF